MIKINTCEDVVTRPWNSQDMWLSQGDTDVLKERQSWIVQHKERTLL